MDNQKQDTDLIRKRVIFWKYLLRSRFVKTLRRFVSKREKISYLYLRSLFMRLRQRKTSKRFRRSSTACTPRRNCPIFSPWPDISSSPPSVSSISRANSVAYFLIRKAASSCSAMEKWLKFSRRMFVFSSKYKSPSSRNMKWHQVEK